MTFYQKAVLTAKLIPAIIQRKRGKARVYHYNNILAYIDALMDTLVCSYDMFNTKAEWKNIMDYYLDLQDELKYERSARITQTNLFMKGDLS
jgi:hypothetical protein